MTKMTDTELRREVARMAPEDQAQTVAEWLIESMGRARLAQNGIAEGAITGGIICVALARLIPEHDDLPTDELARRAERPIRDLLKYMAGVGWPQDALRSALLVAAVTWLIDAEGEDGAVAWLKTIALQLEHGGDDDVAGHA